MEERVNKLLPLATKIAREFSNIPGLPHAEIELAAHGFPPRSRKHERHHRQLSEARLRRLELRRLSLPTPYWKISSNENRETLPDGTKRVRFEPVAPHLTEDAMRVLHEHFADARRDGIWDPLFLIPFYILDFLCIHPFADGNGRMARLLSLLALYHQGYDVGRYISLFSDHCSLSTSSTFFLSTPSTFRPSTLQYSFYPTLRQQRQEPQI